MWWFYLSCRLLLAFAFLMAGMVKIIGERFASGLPVKHPMGAYLEALHQTGYYYTFIGVAQVIAAVLLLFRRTVLLGALLYLPIIINIWLLSFAVRFEGSYVTSPLMVLANLFILTWHYDRLRYVLPFQRYGEMQLDQQPEHYDNTFPFFFFGGVFMAVAAVVLYANFGHEVMPRNSFKDCNAQFLRTSREPAGLAFCDCIHNQGKSLGDCLLEFEHTTPNMPVE